ncbi:MAG: LCP family protein, partial [Eubacteriales bacterium]|nr:LCP family protein [Eubacteriales bacterium]
MLWKRWIAALLSAVLLVCCMPALAEEGASLIEEEEEIDVSEMVKVDDLAANGKLDDKGWWNILLLGGDSREDGSYGRTDAIIILSVNPSTNEVKLTSVMRDIYVQMYGAGSNRINAACRLGGPELVMRTINETLGMNLVDYALVNMAAFKDIVDILGGIELNVEEREVASINEQQYYNLRELGLEPVYEKLETFGEGTKLDGNQALAYVRLRHIDSDMARTGRQRDALVAIAKKLQQEGTITTIASIALTLLSYVETNL